MLTIQMRKLMMFCLVAVFSAVLVGCGGGSSNSGLKNDLADAKMSLGEAQAAVEKLQEELADATDDATDEQVEMLQADLKKAQDELDVIAAAEKKRIADAKAEEARIAANVPSGEIAAEILKDKATIASKGDIITAVTAERGVDGVTKITLMPKNTGTSREWKASNYMAPAISGWSGGTWTRGDDDNAATMDDEVEMVTVYTDIAVPGNADYLTYFEVPGGDAERANVSGFDDTTGVVMLAAIVTDPTAFSPLQDAPTDSDSTVINEGRMNSFTGTFYGIPGKYSCTSDSVDCQPDYNSAGVLTGLDGTWTFTPDAIEGTTATDLASARFDYMVRGVIKDTDYLYFGYWLETTQDGDDTMNSGIDAFSGGSMAPVASSTFTDLRGTAKYEGSAAGRYVHKTLLPNGDPNVARNGQFTADVSLTADFEGPDIAMSSEDMLRGTIDSFMDGTTELPFEVELKATSFATLEQEETGDGGATGTGTGAWRASFYEAATQAAPRVEAEEYPNSVAGVFNDHFVNGHVIGGFGATKTDD